MTRIVLITGPPGIGKTSAAQALTANLEGTRACLCGDVFVLAVTPFEINDDRRQFLGENLTSFIRYSTAHEYDWVVLECVIPSDEFIQYLKVSAGVPPGNFHVFSLLASESAYETRLKQKLENYDTHNVDFARSREWLTRIRNMAEPVSIDTSRQTLEQTVAVLLNRILK